MTYLFWKEAELAVDLGPDPVGCGPGVARELLLVLQQVDEVAGLAGFERVQRAELIQKSENTNRCSPFTFQPGTSPKHYRYKNAYVYRVYSI